MSIRRYENGKMRSEYLAWRSMKDRCTNENCTCYAYYGGRGIKICERWRSFENFLADMGEKPSKAHSLDRKNNNGDYCPENCRWATKEEQEHNKRTSRLSAASKTGITGVSIQSKKARIRAYIAWATIEGRQKQLYYGGDFFEACCRRKSWEVTQQQTS